MAILLTRKRRWMALLAAMAASGCTSAAGGGGTGAGGVQFVTQDIKSSSDAADTPEEVAATEDGSALRDVDALDDLGTPLQDSQPGDATQPDDTAPLTDVTQPPDAGPVSDGKTGADALPWGSAGLQGLVLDEDDLPLAGVKVTHVGLGYTTLTDGAGHFKLEQVVPQDPVRLRFEKAGYAHIERPVHMASGEISRVRVRLLKKGPTETVSAQFGGVAHHPRGNVQFKPASLLDQNGKLFQGDAHVAVTHLDPGTNQIDAAPGNFQAQTAQGALSVLESFAMVEVELTDDVGNPLSLAAGKTAVLDLDLPVTTKLKVGDQVPMWHYDEVAKLWIEEGTSTVVKSSRDPKRLAMVASVAHFSWWNCDKSGGARCISGVVRGCTGKPLSGVTIEARGQSANVQDGDSSKTGGEYCVMGYLGQPTTVTYRQGNRIAKEVTVTPTGGGAFCGGNCLPQPDVTVCFSGCARGAVADSDGKPIAGAQVFVPAGALGTTTEGPAAFSADSGEFRLDALTLDPLKVQVHKPGYLPGELTVQPVGATNPDTTCPAVPDVVLLQQPCLGGSVQDQAGQPLPNALVRFEPAGGASPLVTSTGSDGAYLLKVPVGASGKLVIEGGNFWPVSQALKITANVACTPQDAQIVPPVTLTQWGCATGVVKDVNGKGLAGIQVAAGADAGGKLVTTGKDGAFCIEGPVGQPMLVGASGKGLAGSVQTLTLGKSGVCGGATCTQSAVELQMKPTVFDHLDGFWKDCQTVLGDVQIGDLQVQGSAQGLEQVQGMHAVAWEDVDGTRRVAILLSDAAGPAVLGKGKSLWFAEMAIGPQNTAQVVSYSLPALDPTEPNATTRLRGQIISKTGGQLGIDASLFRLSTTAQSKMTVVFDDSAGDKAGAGFFDLAFESDCGVGSGTARVTGSFVLKKLLKLPIADPASAEGQAWQTCYQGYDSAAYWTSSSIGSIDAVTVDGKAKTLGGAGTVIYAARDKGLLGDAAVPTDGLALAYSGTDLAFQGHLPKLAIGKNSLGLGSFCGGLGFLACCSGTPASPVSLSCGSGSVEAKVGGCKTFANPLCPQAIGGAAMSVTLGACKYKLEPEDATVTLTSTGGSPLSSALTGSWKAKLTTLTSGTPAVCKPTDVQVDFTAAACKVAPAANLGFQHAADPAP
jgi:hypothetical protein